MTCEERIDMMVEKHGEVCTRAAAARIMGRDPHTITRWLQRGIIDAACAGTMVDVRSLARYISAPAEITREVRRREHELRTGCEFYV